jgi:stalled ribosome rescue protein Dom34
MKKQTGVWLDKEKAIIINLDEGKHSIKYIDSDIEGRERFPGEGKNFGRFGSQFLSMENKKKNRTKKQLTTYLKRIVSEIKNADEIVLFGPAEMKTELEKLILDDHTFKGKLLGVKPADSITENQIVAWVKEFFREG